MNQAHLLTKDFLSKLAESVHTGISALDKEAASSLAFALVDNLIKTASALVSDLSTASDMSEGKGAIRHFNLLTVFNFTLQENHPADDCDSDSGLIEQVESCALQFLASDDVQEALEGSAGAKLKCFTLLHNAAVSKFYAK